MRDFRSNRRIARPRQAAHSGASWIDGRFGAPSSIGLGPFAEGDVAIVNDPLAGGTHLPDITIVAPVIHEGSIAGYVANRAHHADVGGTSPGSMTLSRHIDEEGVPCIEPSFLYPRSARFRTTCSTGFSKPSAPPDERLGDLDAQ